MALDREALIGGLAAEFEKDKGVEVKIDKSNYIEPTNSLNCTALGLPLDTLKKTKNVVMEQKEAFKKLAEKDRDAAQSVMHLEVAIKCIDEVIAQKMKTSR